MEISWIFKKYALSLKFKRWIIFWLLYMVRNILDILSGIIGILTLGIIETGWSLDISEKILKNQLRFHKENANNKSSK